MDTDEVSSDEELRGMVAAYKKFKKRKRASASSSAEGSSKKSKAHGSGSTSLGYLRQGLIDGGWRPTSSGLNTMLDVVSFEMAEMERELKLERAARGDRSRTSNSGDEGGTPNTNKHIEDPDATSMPIMQTDSPGRSARKGIPLLGDDTTDDEDFSPHLFPYKSKSKASVQSQKSIPDPTPEKLNFVSLGDLSPTPEKHTFMSPGPGSSNKQFQTKVVRRQLNLDSKPTYQSPTESTNKTEIIPPAENAIMDRSTFLEDSPITLDSTPPRPLLRIQKRNSSFSLLDPTTREEENHQSTSSVGNSAKKKEVWLDQDFHIHRQTSSSSFPIASKKGSGTQNKSKQFRQQSLVSMARNMPKKKVDVSTLKEFNGGSRTQSQSSNFREPDLAVSRAKRKSDETVESPCAGKRDKLLPKFVPDSSFDVSPIKLPVPSPVPDHGESFLTSPSPPRAGTSKSMKTLISKKPLSPVNSAACNILNNIDKKSKPGGSKSKDDHNFTYDLLKDFDKIPSTDSPSPKFKYKQPTVRKKAERAQLPGWDCDECKGYYGLLESQMDELEIARIRNRCSRHKSKAPVVSNTPENFWCTYIPSTEEMYRDGYIKIGTPFTPPPRRRRRNSDSDDNGNEEAAL